MNEDKEEYSLYTEKIVLSPKVKYKWHIRFLKLFLFAVVVFAAGSAFSLYILPKLEKYFNKNEEKPRDVIYIEKDEYNYNDEQYEEDPDIITEQDLKENYEFAMTTLRSKVEEVQKCVVTVDNVKQKSESTMLETQSDTDSAGLVVAYLNYQYMILTSNKVIDTDKSVIVELNDGSFVNAKLWCENDETGLCLLTINASDLTAEQKKSISVAYLDNSYKVRQGDMAIFYGKLRGNSKSIDYGIISGSSMVYGLDNGYEVLETNIAKQDLDYGFLFSSEGRVIGVGVVSEEGYLKATGISDLKTIMEKLINDKNVLYCGISAQNVTKELSVQYDLPIGIYISSVDIDSPAYLAGLQAGDVIVSVDDDEVLTIQTFNEKLYRYSENEAMQVKYKRLGKDDYSEIITNIIIKSK